MRYLVSFLLVLMSSSVFAQWVLSPEGTGMLIDSISGKEYMIVERPGTKNDLYNEVLKNVHLYFVNPDNVVSTIENEMISVSGWDHTQLKFAGLTGTLDVQLAVKIEFKPDKMRVSAQIVNFRWMGGGNVDPYTLLVIGNLKVFNKKGEMKNEKRYHIINNLCQHFINTLITPAKEDW